MAYDLLKVFLQLDAFYFIVIMICMFRVELIKIFYFYLHPWYNI